MIYHNHGRGEQGGAISPVYRDSKRRMKSMSRDWTSEQLAAASRAMQQMGQMSYEEFCEELNRQRRAVFTYYMRDRHMVKATLPPGVILIVPWGSLPYTPAIGGRCFGKVDFNRQLTAQELIVYGLIPA